MICLFYFLLFVFAIFAVSAGAHKIIALSALVYHNSASVYHLDNQSIAARSGSSSDESIIEDKATYDDDQLQARSSTSGDSASRKSLRRHRITNNPPTATTATTPLSPKRSVRKTNSNINSSSSITNVPKMTTRYRFRDLLLGDFSFNDDGER